MKIDYRFFLAVITAVFIAGIAWGNHEYRIEVIQKATLINQRAILALDKRIDNHGIKWGRVAQ